MIFKNVIDALTAGGSGRQAAAKVSASGLYGASKALFLWEIAQGLGRPVLALTATPKEAETLLSDYLFFAKNMPRRGAGQPASAPLYFPPWDVLPYDVMEPDPECMAGRLRALRDIHSGTARVVIAPAAAILRMLPAPGSLLSPQKILNLTRGGDYPREPLLARLTKLGYSRVSMVYEPGEFSVRGGILDLYPPGSDMPARIEFFGDTVESIREFDPDTQRSTGEADEVEAIPASETEAGRAGRPAAGRAGADQLPATVIDYFPESPFLFMDEPERIFTEAGEFERRAFSAYEAAAGAASGVAGRPARAAAPAEMYLSAEGLKGLADTLTSVYSESLPLAPRDGGVTPFEYRTRSIEGLRLRDSAPDPWPEDLPRTPVNMFCGNLKNLMPGRAINVVPATAGQAERLGEIFAEHGIPAVMGEPILCPETEAGSVRIIPGNLEAGFLMDGAGLPTGRPLPDSQASGAKTAGLAFITSTEIFGEKPKWAGRPAAGRPAQDRQARPAATGRQASGSKVERFLTSLSELKTGDFVVHIDHGIGRYMGLKRLTLMGVEGDFLEVVYAGADRLYVPVDELHKVQKYIGSEGAAPSLEKLGGVGWERAKSRAKTAVREMAGELLELYAKRSVAPGFAYSEDDHLYREMEASFEYEETPDQARAIEDVKKDLASPHPMDRLVCGDVGYGKTEVAVRAAFKVVLDGKQAAVLVPTTLLADQHHETFSQRLAAFPVRVEVLSRFTPKEKINEIKKGMADGTVDVIIGTHRLLQKGIEFKDLGLLVVDEEHRFGVAHKEKLKQLRKTIDVLTLTATPIPRTLNLSITGIRDLSIIETPPPERQPIKTVVTRFDNSIIREAIRRELSRGGQVFFVHNRIDSIFAVGNVLKQIVPEASIGVAHGRMREDALEEVMSRFVKGDYNVLLTTSIVESGLDIPSANTIIIDRADRFGLADLYQLRGRVGRSSRRAYAYLLVPGEDTLTETATKRLRVLSELSELGAGFKLALHDLEIRGAGNILGAEQSGHISAVGFELYTHMLEQAVRELKGEETAEETEPALDLKVSAFIPEGYVPDTAHRLGIYKRLSSAKNLEELADLRDELKDRYGEPAGPVKRLLEVMELKVLARNLSAAGIRLLPSEIKITFTPGTNISSDKLIAFLEKNKGRARYVPEYTVFLRKPSGDWEAQFREIKNSLKALA
ncbi:MAG: transcription-repair coupling factor [Nitrospirota bacterium]